MANPWFPFYVDDYERKTSHLTLLERGAYSELIRRYYMIGGPLPAIALQVHRMCRATDQQESDAIDYCLSEFFRLEDDGYHNDRCDEEIACAASMQQAKSKGGQARASMLGSERRSDIAKSAAEARWKTKDLPSEDANKMLAPMLAECLPSTATSTKNYRAKKSTTFPDGYQPTDSHKELAASLGINLRESFPAFRDFHTSKGNTFKDWDAALRTWLRNERKFSKVLPTNQASPPNAMDKFKANVERLKGAN